MCGGRPREEPREEAGKGRLESPEISLGLLFLSFSLRDSESWKGDKGVLGKM